MDAKIILYGLTILLGSFITTGLNINSIFKKNYVWEARLFNVTLVIAISYILTNFLYDIVMNYILIF